MTVSTFFFNTLRHGDLEELDAILDARELTNAELRAVIQNLTGEVIRLKKAVDRLEYRVDGER